MAARRTLILDNEGANVRIGCRTPAPVTLSGGTFYFKGNSSTPSTETVGPLVLATNTASILRSDFGGVAGQALTFTASSGSVLVRNTGATLQIVSNDDFVFGTHDLLFVPTGTAIAPALTGGVLPFVTVTTFAGSSGEAIDLAGNIDTGSGFSLGRLATYDSSNVRATGDVTLGATINSLLVVGDGITVTVPSGGTSIASGQIVNVGGGTNGNTITGDPLAFGGPSLLFTMGGNAVQELDLNGETSGTFTLTLPLNTAAAPVTGATQVAASNQQTTVVLDIATLNEAKLRAAWKLFPQ